MEVPPVGFVRKESKGKIHSISNKSELQDRTNNVKQRTKTLQLLRSAKK
jgi:hypothetical protein